MSSGKGYIFIYRDIWDHWLWEDKPFSRGQAWIDLIMMVNHEDKKILFNGNLIEVKRGSKITSIRILAERWGWSQGKVSRFLDALESERMISQKRSSKNTVLTVENYGVYQSKPSKNGAQTKHRRSTDGEQTENRRSTDGDKQYTNKYTNKYTKEEEASPVLTDEELEAEGWGYD